MLTFLFWVPKMPKKNQKYFYTHINLWTAIKFGFQEQLFMKKPRKNLQGVLFSRRRSKTLILAKIYKTWLEDFIFDVFYRRFQKSKNIRRIMSHSVTIWRNVNVASFFAPDNWTYLWSQILIYICLRVRIVPK